MSSRSCKELLGYDSEDGFLSPPYFSEDKVEFRRFVGSDAFQDLVVYRLPDKPHYAVTTLADIKQRIGDETFSRIFHINTFPYLNKSLYEEVCSLEDGSHVLEEHNVECQENFKVEIFSNEHPPPHFRVLNGGESNCFLISDCSPMYGTKKLGKLFKKIKKWHKTNKKNLEKAWNTTRPSNCTVGPIKKG